MDRSRLSECEEYLGYRFARLELLDRALTHASTKTPSRPSNERLEFLGDSVLGLVIVAMATNRINVDTGMVGGLMLSRFAGPFREFFLANPAREEAGDSSS